MQRVARSGELTPNAGEGGEEEEQSRVEEELPLWVGCACCSLFIGLIVLLIVAGYKLSPGADAFDQTRVVALKKDEMFRTVIYPTQGRSLHRGPNGKATDWAVFFYKPYCPACKRVWPVFRALGNTVNDSGLRFGEVDCVRDRGLCNLVGAESHPLIRIYKAVPSQAKESNWKRESVAEWQGLLIAYEINQWFIDQQAAGVIQAGVEWPSPERLALEMRSLKASGRVSHETTMLKRPQNAGGYIHDAELALQYGLIDHVLMSSSSDGSSKPTLSGERLLSLLRWISLQQEMFPRSAVRDKLEALFKRLQHRCPVDLRTHCSPHGAFETLSSPNSAGHLGVRLHMRRLCVAWGLTRRQSTTQHGTGAHIALRWAHLDPTPTTMPDSRCAHQLSHNLPLPYPSPFPLLTV
ncbi:MAG: hypothetical protein SGPRY_000475 [Prymnesium sp.]